LGQENNFKPIPGQRCAGCGNALPLCACRGAGNVNQNRSTPSADFAFTVVSAQSSSNLVPHQDYPAAIAGTLTGNHGSAVGSILSDRYELVAKLGTGGMGVVYKARHLALNKLFAIKIVSDHLASQDDFRIRFDREAKAASMLNHPNLVSITDYGMTEFNEPYIVMDFINGRNLAEELTHLQRLSPERAIQIFMQICDGVGYAHQIGLIHRDLKPGNIMLTKAGEPDEQVKIIDFGIAKLLSGQGDVTQSNTRANPIGSPLYMSPEQCSAQRADRRSDIYSMGCLMYECLSSMPPFQGENILSTMSMHMSDAPKPFSPNLQIPNALEEVIMRSLAKNPADRFQTMAELKTVLSHCVWSWAAPETKSKSASTSASASKFKSQSQSQSQSQSESESESESEFSSELKSKPKSAKTTAVISVACLMLLVIGGATALWKQTQNQNNSNAGQPAASTTVPPPATSTTKTGAGTLQNSELSEETKQTLFQQQMDNLGPTLPVDISDQNKTPRELVAICKASLKGNKEEKAIAYFKLAAKKDPGLLDSYDALFPYFWDKGERDVAAYKRAIIVTNACLLYRPDEYDYYTNRAMCHRNLHEYPAALDDFGRALACAVRPDQKSQAHLNRAFMHKKMHDPDAAIADFKGNATVRDHSCLCLFADCYVEKGDFKNAIKVATEALRTTSKDVTDPSQLNSTLYWARTIRGGAYKRLGKFVQAKEDYKAALALGSSAELKKACENEILECGKLAEAK
jgi:serine/threonine-protein kinase